MKWLALALALLVVVPLAARQAAAAPRFRQFLVGLLAFDLFNPAHVNFLSDESYRGDSRGLEITTVDLLMVALFVAQRRRGVQGGRPRFLIVRILSMVSLLLSLTGSPDVMRSLFGVWKLARMFCMFSVLATAFLELELVQSALMGLALGVASQGLLALQQKYLHHMVRSFGSQSHPNSLAMLVNLIMPVAFSLIMAGKARWIAVVVVVFAAMCDLFSLSRGGMLMFGLALTLVTIGSFLRGITTRKTRIVAGVLLGSVLVLAKSAATIIQRFTEAPKESEQARVLFNAAARAMANDHVFGVGINMYSFVLDHGGYADMFDVDPGDRNGIAHHIYWLTAAETGYVGLVTYLGLLAAVLLAAIREAVRPGLTGDIALGIAAGLTVTYVQGTEEWIARQTTMSYCFWMFAAMISAFQVSWRGRVQAR
jgi:O-antigen ligase